MNTGLNELYQELIIDHGTEPRNNYVLNTANRDIEGFNPLCGDKLHIYLLVENDIINDITCVSTGCAISTASASIMTQILKGKTIQEAKDIFRNFKHLLGSDNASEQQDLGKLNALIGVKAYPSRIKCATLAWHTMYKALE